MSELNLALSIALGIGLAAAVGLRVFLPLLAVSAAAYAGYLPLSAEFSWLGSTTALVMLGAATVAEILAYYVPVVDNALDAIAGPMALIAGVVVSAAVMTDLPPAVKWTTAIIAGGGVAGLTQGVTTALRAKSTAFTAGIGNPVLATSEAAGAAVLSGLALLAPFLALALIAIFAWFAIRMVRKLTARRRSQTSLTQ